MSATSGDNGGEGIGEAETTAGVPQGSGSGGGGEAEIDPGELFDLLSNRRRRFAIHYLKQRPDERVGMGELSRQVAAWEEGADPESLSYDERKPVHTSLYQHHAPRLDGAGLVDYDASRGTVALTQAGRDVDLYLEAVTGNDLPWAAYFTLLSALGVVTVLGVGVGILPNVRMGVAWGGAIAVGFLVSSLVFLYDMRTRMQLGSAGPPPEAIESRTATDPVAETRGE